MNSHSGADAPRKPCGLARRFLVMIYDAIVVITLLMLATACAMLAGMSNKTAMRDPVYTAGLIMIWFLYLGWCWHKGGMTLGMRAWRVCIEDEAGNHPGWSLCALRFLVSLCSAACAGLGFTWSVFETDRRTWHDMASRTRLLRY
jgi:uncharacterized RDD family membrane protein YckC